MTVASAGPGTALVRPPTPSLVDAVVTHIERTPMDFDLAMRQWHAYVEALVDYGWDIVEVAANSACPDAVFIEDVAVVAGGTALVCHPGAPTRRAEVGPVAETLDALGYDLHEVMAPATIDGGDVLKVARTMYIGHGGRTNAAGITAAADVFEAVGLRVVAVPNTKVLHLKSAVTAIEDRIIGYEPVVESTDAFPNFLAMPEESGAHVVDLGESAMLMAASCPESVEIVGHLGYTPVVVDISEFEKAEGCVTCLSIRLRNSPNRNLD